MRPRMLYELIVEACPENELNMRREDRTIRTYRLVLAAPFSFVATRAEQALHGQFLLYMRPLHMKVLRKAKRSEPELFYEITDITDECMSTRG